MEIVLTEAQVNRLQELFVYHPPVGDQAERYQEIRVRAYDLAMAILALVPEGADQSAAIRKVREAVMTANAGIALGGRA